MNLGTALGESFAYAKEGLVGKWMKWILLIILEILPAIPIIAWALVFVGSMITGNPHYLSLMGGLIIAIIIALLLGAIYQGFVLKILRGEKPLPEVANYSTLFADGIRYIVIEIIYMIPVIIVLAAVAGAAILAVIKKGISTQNIAAAVLGPVLVGVLVAVVLAFILCLIATIGVIRYARTGKMGEAFNFREIFTTMGRIGWGNYILALIVIALIVGIIYAVLGMILVVWARPIIEIIVAPFITVFAARYICQLYDSAGTA